MQADLDYCLDQIGSVEAGFSNNRKDPGGPTNHGITQRTLAGWRGAPVTIGDVQALTEEEARKIIVAQYATPIRFDVLKPGVDYMLLDASVNSGPGRAVKILQSVLGMKGNDLDGVLGIHTKSVLDGVNDIDGLIVSYCAARLDFMQKLRTWSEFGNGWTSRVNRVQAASVQMATSDNSPLPPARAVIVDLSERAKATGSTKLMSSLNGKAAVASIAGGVIFAATIADQLSTVLAPYSSVQAVAYVLLACSVVTSSVPLFTTLKKAASGENSA